MAIKDRESRLGRPLCGAAGLRRNTRDPQEYWWGPGERKAFLELLFQKLSLIYKETREADH